VLSPPRITRNLFAPLPQTSFSDEPPGQVYPEVRNVLAKLKAQQGIYENRRNSILK